MGDMTEPAPSPHRVEVSCQEEGTVLDVDLTPDELAGVRKVQAALNKVSDADKLGWVGPWISIDDEIGA